MALNLVSLKSHKKRTLIKRKPIQSSADELKLIAIAEQLVVKTNKKNNINEFFAVVLVHKNDELIK